jgi:hypothetical protein
MFTSYMNSKGQYTNGPKNKSTEGHSPAQYYKFSGFKI